MAILDLSIIIISFNTKDLLKTCIKSIYETTKNLNYEIIVVDNASSDGSPEAIEKAFNGVTVIKNNENLGFAKANNQAIKVARGKYLLLLNSDTILKEGTIENMVQFIDKHPNAAAVGPKVLNVDGTLQFKGFSFPSITSSLLILFGAERIFSKRLLYKLFTKFYWDDNSIVRVDFMPGCCLLIRKDIIDKIGFLPEEYFMYFEEAEWCYIARKNGYEVWYLPTSEIIHIGSASSNTKKEKLLLKSMILFYKRNIGIIKGISIILMLLLATVIAFFRVLVKPNYPSELEVIKKQLGQHVKLLRGLLFF